MAYRLERDETVEAAVRRIAVEQIEKSIARIDARDPETGDVVHDLRKRCKKLRGLVRLVRPAFDGYAAENAAFRDAARTLSFLRDAEVLGATLDSLLDDPGDRPAPARLRALRRRLRARHASGDADEALAAFRETMIAARRRAAAWELRREGFAAIAGGARRTYARARRAHEAPAADAFHEWRKRAKYHAYHARLLREAWPRQMTAHAKAAEELADLLGRHHDLAVLCEALAGGDGTPPAAAPILGLAERRQATLAARAFLVGGRLLAERPKALVRRWDRYWTVWRAEAAAA